MTLSSRGDALFGALPDDELERFAVFSPCRRYRYALGRTWDLELKPVLFVGLNPSTADESLGTVGGSLIVEPIGCEHIGHPDDIGCPDCAEVDHAA